MPGSTRNCGVLVDTHDRKAARQGWLRRQDIDESPKFAFSRPGRSKIGSLPAALLQRHIADRYLTEMRALEAPGFSRGEESAAGTAWVAFCRSGLKWCRCAEEGANPT